jgi:hypothetical protein
LNDSEILDRTVVEPAVRSPGSKAQGRDDLKTERHGRGTGGTLPKKDRNTGGSFGDPDPHVFGPPEFRSGSVSQRYECVSCPFLIKVLSGLK